DQGRRGAEDSLRRQGGSEHVRDDEAGRQASEVADCALDVYHGFGAHVICIDDDCCAASTEHDAQASTSQSFLLLYGRSEMPSACGRNDTCWNAALVGIE